MLNNNLLLYFLAGAGRAIGGQGSVGDVLGQGVQQQIGAESQSKVNAQYMKMLQGMLAGGGKINMDKDNINIKAPIGAFNNNSGGQTPPMSSGTSALGSIATSNISDTSGGNWMKDYNSGGLMSTYLNPSNSPSDVIGANQTGLENVPQAQVQSADIQPIPREMLVGLTPENVSQALGGAVSVNNLRESKISEVANRILKTRELDMLESERKAELQLKNLKEAREWQTLMRESPLEVPGLGKMTFDNWKELDAPTKSYSYYAFDAKNRGEEVMSFNDWKQQSPPESIYEIYELAEKDPKFKEFFFRQKEAGATRISTGEIVDRKKLTDEVDIKNYFRTKLPEDVDKFISSKETRRDLIQYTEPKEKTKQTMLAKDKFIRGKIVSTGGDIMDIVTEGRTRVYKVKWKDGSTDEVRYAF